MVEMLIIVVLLSLIPLCSFITGYLVLKAHKQASEQREVNLPYKLEPEQPRELTEEEIKEIKRQQQQAAKLYEEYFG